MGLRFLHRELALLRRSPPFRLLWLATLGSGVGTWIAFVALTVHVYDQTRSAAWVSALLVVEFLPTVFVGLFLGPLLDRLSRRGLMIAADVVRAAVFISLVFVDTPVAIVALAGVAGFAGSFFRPAVYAGLPNLVEERELPRANSLFQAVDSLTTAVGPVLGGAIVAVSAPAFAYGANAVSFVVSALLVVRIPTDALQEARASTRGHLRDLAAAISLVVRVRPLLTVLAVWSLVVLAGAALNVSEVVLAKETFDSGDLGFGLLVGAAGFGIAAGSLAGGALVDRFGILRVYTLSIGLIGAGTLVAAAMPTVWAALAFVAISGAGNGAALVANALLVQHGAPDAFRGRVFTFLMGATAVVTVAGMVAAGPLTDALGARWIWAASGTIAFVGAALALLLGRTIAADELGEPDAERVPAPVLEPVARETEAAL